MIFRLAYIIVILALHVYSNQLYGQDFKKMKKDELIELASQLTRKSDSLVVEINKINNRFRTSEFQRLELQDKLKSTEKKLYLTSKELLDEKDRFTISSQENINAINKLNSNVSALKDSIVKITSPLKNTVHRAPLNYGGSYGFGSDPEKGPVGFLDIYPISETEFLFNLSANRGAPSYNSGQVSGKMSVKSDIGTYTDDDCGLKFKFSNNSVQVLVDPKKSDCQTGHGVRLDGIYKLETNVVPIYFEDMTGEKTYFKDMLMQLSN
jgi:hypothetical protein